MIEIKNIVKTYRPKKGGEVKALDDVSLKFPENGLVFILGKSGSGKSTLLNVMGGLDTADSGEIFGKTMDEVTPDERRKAKAVNFGLMYGMGAFGLARRLRIDRKDAADYIALYFSRFPKVKTFISDLLETAHRTGYVETITGRHLFVPGIQGKGMALRAAERVATNAPLQGSAADLIKLAMVKVAKFIEDKPLVKRDNMNVRRYIVKLADASHNCNVYTTRAKTPEDAAQMVCDYYTIYS